MVYDVIVVGGGTTGCCAALAAARAGANTALIECEGFLGGNAANGLPWLGFHHPDTGEQVVKGLPEQIIRRLQKVGGATRMETDPICGSAVGVNATLLKMTLFQWMKEYGVTVHLHAFAGNARREKEGWRLQIFHAGGTSHLSSSILIDCTDSGSIAASAGVCMHLGRAGDHQPQVASSVIRFGPVQVEEIIAYFRRYPLQMRPFKIGQEQLQQHLDALAQKEIFVIGAFPELIAQAKEAGLSFARDRLIGVVNAKAREMILVCSRVTGVDPWNNERYSAAEADSLLQTQDIWHLLREYLPGCKNAVPIASGHTLGLRETYHMKGDYCLTADDLLHARLFPDAIACGGYHLDVHSPDHGGLNSSFSPVYRIPYRVMLPQNQENLLVAGRCVCATQEAQASIRVIPISAAMGEAAGQAAAWAVQNGCAVRDVDIGAVQRALKSHGAYLP